MRSAAECTLRSAQNTFAALESNPGVALHRALVSPAEQTRHRQGTAQKKYTDKEQRLYGLQLSHGI